MGKLVAAMDWSKTPLGPIGAWPQSLRTTVSLCLASNFPISLAWGPRHIQIYNDGYWPICGGKHPTAMGEDFTECWASAWPAIGAAFASALAGQASYIENQRMFLDRLGYLEETFFTFSFSPIRDESGKVGGLFHPVTEQTGKMLSERRTRALRDLAARTGKAKTIADVFELAAQTLADYDLDLPFVLFYRRDGEGAGAELAAHVGLPPGTAVSPLGSRSEAPVPGWPLAEVLRSGNRVQVDRLHERFGAFSVGALSRAAEDGDAVADPGARLGSRHRRPRRRRQRAAAVRRRLSRVPRYDRGKRLRFAWRMPAPTRISAGAPRRWPSLTGQRRRSSAMSAMNSARRSPSCWGRSRMRSAIPPPACPRRSAAGWKLLIATRCACSSW